MHTSLNFQRVTALLIAASLTPWTSACAPKKADKGAAAENIKADIAEVMAARRKRIVSMMPTEDSPKGDDEHPWLDWVKKIASTPQSTEVQKAGLHAKGDGEEQVEMLAHWLDAMKAYYVEEKIEPNEYWTQLGSARRVSKGTPWEEDTEFETLFFHAARLAKYWTLQQADSHDDRVISFFTYWKFVFDFNPKTAIYEDEVNVVCATKLGDFCKDIPMEERPFQVMRPYYEGYVKQVQAFQAKFPNSPYNTLLGRVAAIFKERGTKIAKWQEFPVLPEIRSTIPAPVRGNAILEITSKGVTVFDNAVRAVDKGWKADWTPDAKLSEEISKLTEEIRAAPSSAFNQSEVKLVAEANVPVKYFEPLLKSFIIGEHAKEWAVEWLVGRRRLDGSNRRAGYQIYVLPKEKAIAFKLRVGGKASQCSAWAVVGRDPFEAKGFQAVAYHDGKAIHLTKVGNDGAILSDQTVPSGPDSAERLDNWADGQTVTLAVAVQENVTYEQWLEALNGVALDCDKDECKLQRNQPVFIATCK